jgi:hypothetical protein
LTQGAFLYNYCMRHYYVLNSNPHLEMIFEFIQHHDLKLEVHLNRTRFWVPDGTILTEFLLRFSTVATLVDESVDLATGHSQ